VALLDVRDALVSDKRLTAVAFNGHVRVIDPRTGLEIEPCLITLSVDRSDFEELNLNALDPVACLRHLNALVSPHPLDLEPVTPMLSFDLAKYALVEGMDAAAGLDARPVLTDSTPTEFEHLVRQLCESMGLQSWTTRQSGDEGVDAVVFNPDPLLGGECVVQAKRYKREIGPQHIRELIGAMDGKRAGRGILMTTSWFTPGALRVAHENNRVSCIDGAQLVTLIKQHLQKDVLAGTFPPKRRTTQ
jgi:restriction system protein